MPTSSNLTLIAAPFTPFDENDAVRPDLIPEYYHHLAGQGVRGAFLCGTTGEGASLTVEERKQVAEAWIAARGDEREFRLFVHAGHECLADAREIARHASRSGADAVSALSPSFFTPGTLEAAVDHAARVADAADGLPFYFYHLPSMTGMNQPMVPFLKLAKSRIPNLAGLKFTHHDLGEFHDCLGEFGDDLEIFFGRDELLLEALAVGATGAVGTTYNFAAPLYLEIAASFEAGDRPDAAALQARARRMIDCALARGGLAGLKGALTLTWRDCGFCRPPLPRLSPEELAALGNDLQDLGFRLAQTS